MEGLKSSEVDHNGDPIELPPGFRFHPTDEELVTHYLSPKVMNSFFSSIAIGEVDLNKCEPWDLPGKAKMGEKEWYFFCVRDRKYPTGVRTNRATEAGYWKATGKDKEIYRGETLIGMKKTLVFYGGRAPKGLKSSWVMHEYRSQATDSVYSLPKPKKDEWVVCRVFEKNSGSKKGNISGFEMNSSSVLPPLMDSSSPKLSHVACFPTSMEDEILSVSNSSYPRQICPNFSNFQNPDFSQLPNSFFFKFLLENQLTDMKPISRAELSPEEAGLNADISSVISNHKIGQDDPSTATEPADLDCLWNY